MSRAFTFRDFRLFADTFEAPPQAMAATLAECVRTHGDQVFGIENDPALPILRNWLRLNSGGVQAMADCLMSKGVAAGAIEALPLAEVARLLQVTPAARVTQIPHGGRESTACQENLRTMSIKNADPFLDSLDGPLASIGPLPRDLLDAFNAAVWFAGTASSIGQLLQSPTPGPECAETVAGMVKALKERWNECRAAVHAVTNELSAVRDSPAWFGALKEPNAHQAALAMGSFIKREVWIAADPDQWAACLLDPSARMDPQSIVRNFPAVCEHFRALHLPDSKEIISACQMEAAKAARARNAFTLEPGETSTARPATPDPEPDATQPKLPFRELLEFAESGMKGKERRIIELVCATGGSCPLADLAADPAIQWEFPWDNAYNRARARINKKLKINKQPWTLGRQNNCSILRAKPK